MACHCESIYFLVQKLYSVVVLRENKLNRYLYWELLSRFIISRCRKKCYKHLHYIDKLIII